MLLLLGLRLLDEGVRDRLEREDLCLLRLLLRDGVLQPLAFGLMDSLKSSSESSYCRRRVREDERDEVCRLGERLREWFAIKSMASSVSLSSSSSKVFRRLVLDVGVRAVRPLEGVLGEEARMLLLPLRTGDRRLGPRR